VTIREPEPGAWDKIDWEALDAVEARARTLFMAGPIPLDVWRDIWTSATKAADNRVDALETLRLYRPEGWEAGDEK
jgi:hypothetical protein